MNVPTLSIPRHEHALTLRSRRLAVDIAAPGGSVYRGSRFDWSGLVTQVTLDGRHTFCGRESEDGTGGVGLCNEFGIDRPIGYDDAAPGQRFPKLGVGLLTRTDHEPYRFDAKYPVEPFPVHTRHGEAGSACYIDFEFAPVPCRGYAVRLHKKLTVRDCDLLIAYTLENVGDRPLRTTEYNHNFLQLNGHAPGPGQWLVAPCDLQPAMSGVRVAGPGVFTWRRRPAEAFYARDAAPGPGVRRWKLVHAISGLWVSEETSTPWAAFALFVDSAVISPEAFLDVDVPPGGQKSWWRRYSFGVGDPGDSGLDQTRFGRARRSTIIGEPVR